MHVCIQPSLRQYRFPNRWCVCRVLSLLLYSRETGAVFTCTQFDYSKYPNEDVYTGCLLVRSIHSPVSVLQSKVYLTCN